MTPTLQDLFPTHHKYLHECGIEDGLTIKMVGRPIVLTNRREYKQIMGFERQNGKYVPIVRDLSIKRNTGILMSCIKIDCL